MRVSLGNDVQVATDAEAALGAGRDRRSLLGVFWGTGVGGGLVLGRKRWLGRGSAGEIGHVVVKRGGAECPCGRRGCMEAYAGRKAMEERARRLAAKGRKTVLFEIMEKRGRDRLTSGIWARALKQHDELATELIDRAVEALGTGIASSVNLIDAGGGRDRRRARRPARRSSTSTGSRRRCGRTCSSTTTRPRSGSPSSATSAARSAARCCARAAGTGVAPDEGRRERLVSAPGRDRRRRRGDQGRRRARRRRTSAAQRVEQPTDLSGPRRAAGRDRGGRARGRRPRRRARRGRRRHAVPDRLSPPARSSRA